MKKLKLIIALCALTISIQAQNSYGITKYPHLGSWLGSGTVTTISPGFLMAGYQLVSTASSDNFTIDRLSVGGTQGTGTPFFQRGYKLFGDPYCTTPNRILNCVGVTTIEKGNGNTRIVGVIGTNKNLIFSTFDNAGIPISLRQYQLPGTPSNVTKPLICQSQINPDRFFIVGSFDGIMYMLKVDSLGTIISQYVCDVSANYYLTPMAIMESPYTPFDLTIVGTSLNNQSQQDGFFYQISNGLPWSGSNVFNTYDITYGNKTNNVFTSIVTANSTNPVSSGFLIGGGSDSQSPGFPGFAWMLKVDQTGTLVWNTIISGTTDPNSGKIYGVVERLNTAGVYECYGACAANSGLTVYKLDNMGVPMNVNYGPTNDEFVYNTGSSSAAWPVSMTYNDIGVLPPDRGLHMFGNLDNTGPGNHYFVEAYFNGITSCNSPLTIAAYDNTSAIAVTSVLDASGANLVYCNNFYITSGILNPYTSICGPFTSVAGGSNNRSIATNLTNLNALEDMHFSITPNPTSQKIAISYNCPEKKSIEVRILNNLGQCIKVLQSANITGPERQSINVDLEALGIANGIYFINANVNGIVFNKKVIYSKE